MTTTLTGPGGSVAIHDGDGHELEINPDGSINTMGGGGGSGDGAILDGANPMLKAEVDAQGRLQVFDSSDSGTWGYYSGVSGTVPITGRVISISAVALQAAGSITINAGSVIPLPYGATDKVSTSLTIQPRGQLVDPTIQFTNTDSYFVEVLT